MAQATPAHALDTTVIKIEQSEDGVFSPSQLEVLNGNLSSDLHERIYIPDGFPPIKGELGDALEGTPGEELLAEEIGDVSFEETDLPDCMFECCYCKILFAEPGSLSRHLEEAHPEMEDINNIQDKLTKDTSLYHIDSKMEGLLDDGSDKVESKKRRMYKDMRVTCDYPGCGKTFIRRGSLHTHQVVHEVSKTCPHCKLDFKTITALLRHIDRKHNVVKASRVDCIYPGCKRTFKNARNLKTHQLVHDEDNLCCVCGMMFTTATSLKQHMQSMHSPSALQSLSMSTDYDVSLQAGGGKHYQQYDNRKAMMAGDGACEEMQVVHYTCSHKSCALVFETQRKLAWHLRYTLHHESQYGDHPFHCPYKTCEMLFQSKSMLCNHRKAEHWGTKKMKNAAAAKLAKESRDATVKPEKPSTQRKCPVCWENFASEFKMKQHLKIQHSTETGVNAKQTESRSLHHTSAETSKPEDGAGKKDLVFDLELFKCPMCHASYHTVNGLKYHFQHHHGCETSLNHLCRLESDSEEFKSIVPATLYGDSFKSRKRKAPSKKRPRAGTEKTVGKLKISMKKSPESLTYTIKKSPEDLKHDIEESPEKSSSSLLNRFSEKSDSDDGTDLDEDCFEIDDIESMKDDSAELDSAVWKIDEPGHGSDVEKTDDDNRGDGSVEGTAKAAIEGAGAGKSPKRVNLMCRYPSCFKRFQNRFELMRHQRTHEKLLKCPHTGCDQGFFNSSNLRLHIQLVHAELQDTKCKDCGIVGKRSYIIYRHPKTCPKTIDLKCPKCGKSFEKISSFTNHVRSHEKKVRTNYVCEYDGCEKKFRTRQDRTRHHNVHSGARPHVCPYANCDKTYKQRPHLLVHMKSSHTIRSDGDKKTYTCEYCGAVFKHSCGRLKHIRKSCREGPNKMSIIADRKRRSSMKPNS